MELVLLTCGVTVSWACGLWSWSSRRGFTRWERGNGAWSEMVLCAVIHVDDFSTLTSNAKASRLSTALQMIVEEVGHTVTSSIILQTKCAQKDVSQIMVLNIAFSFTIPPSPDKIMPARTKTFTGAAAYHCRRT